MPITMKATSKQFHPRSIDAFCERKSISRGTFYNLRKWGDAPDVLKIGSRSIITEQAEREWEHRMAARASGHEGAGEPPSSRGAGAGIGIASSAAMPKEPALSVRLEADERDALERAAKADQRALRAMARKIIADWLREHGWMKNDTSHPPD